MLLAILYSAFRLLLDALIDRRHPEAELWAGRCRLRPFVKLARTIREYVPLIETTLTA